MTIKEYMRQVIEIKPKWLVEFALQYQKLKDVEDSRAHKTTQRQLGKVSLDQVKGY